METRGGDWCNVDAVIDSGAQSSWIDSEWAHKWGTNVMEASNQRARVAGGALLTVQGVLNLPILVGRQNMWVSVKLLWGLGELILGADWLHHTGAILDFSSRIMHVSSEDIPFSSEALVHRLCTREGHVREASIDTLNQLNYIESVQLRDQKVQKLKEKYIDEMPEALKRIEAMELTDVSDQQADELKVALRDLWPIFRQSLGVVQGFEASIRLKIDAKPVQVRVRRRTEEADRVEQEVVATLLRRAIIQPSMSPWAAANVLVKKPNGKWRFTTDLRGLNEQTERDAYPLPLVEEMVDWLARRKWKSTLDMTDGFYQLVLDEGSRPLTAFRTSNGHYEYARMPQGAVNSPAYFQRLAQSALGPEEQKHARVYIDDLTIATNVWAEHVHYVRRVLAQFCAMGMTFSAEKCALARHTVTYLGYEVGPTGVRPGKIKAEGLKSWGTPDGPKAVQRFLGLVGWFRRFIPRFEERAAPLRGVLKGLGMNKKQSIRCTDWAVRWGKDQQVAFDDLRDALADETGDLRVLDIFDPVLHKIVETDASDVGVGAVLYQQHGEEKRPVAFYSRRFRGAENAYSAVEKECLAAVLAIERWKPYLQGQRFVLYTDHSALTWLFNQKMPTASRLQRWVLRLLAFDFECRYRPGRANQVADALSRPVSDASVQKENDKDDDPGGSINGENATGEEACYTWTHLMEYGATQKERSLEQEIESRLGRPPAIDLRQIEDGYGAPTDDELKANYAKDEQIQKALRALESGRETSDPTYVLDEKGLVLSAFRHTGMLRVVPDVLVEQVLNAYHRAPLAGHGGVAATASRIMDAGYWWPGIARDVRDFVKVCPECVAGKMSRPRRAKALMVRYEVKRRFELIGMDVLTISPRTMSGNIKVLVMCDLFTKWTVAVAIPNEKALTIAKTFMENWVFIFGPPEMIFSDRGPAFTSAVIANLAERLGLRRGLTTPYHPESNGQVERWNQTICKMLRAFVSPQLNDWDEWLPTLVYAYNTTRHATTGITPYELMFGQQARDWASMRGPEACNAQNDSECDVEQLLEQCYRKAYKKMHSTKTAYAEAYDRQVKSVTYNPGDCVYVWTPALRAMGRKLVRPWIGPYYVRTARGAHVELSKSKNVVENEMTQVVHVNRLSRPVQEPDITQDAEETHQAQRPSGHSVLWDIACIKAVKLQTGKWQYLVQWRDAHKPTWESEEKLPPLLVAAYRAQQADQYEDSSGSKSSEDSSGLLPALNLVKELLHSDQRGSESQVCGMMHCDSEVAIAWVEKGFSPNVTHLRKGHGISVAAVHEVYHEQRYGNCKLMFVHGVDNPANIFTKPLGPVKFGVMEKWMLDPGKPEPNVSAV
ncbi:Transposon Tf2-9 polyprotein [Porphyridium purpureum]|uniref:RNA-directed DNA polymerase n=1 Tax=Porphyridium purpureum TaxID=35688 RepID=A0A5J4YQC0_PORPP|nr:Transposon Tf2-9 polyprotein [Porphyridium purpureum]|eukprot:POR4976..scf236_6